MMIKMRGLVNHLWLDQAAIIMKTDVTHSGK